MQMATVNPAGMVYFKVAKKLDPKSSQHKQ